MTRKIISVLLCVALLLTLSINVSAEEFLQTEIENITITNEIVVNVGENNVNIIEPTTQVDNNISLAATGSTPIGCLDTVSSTLIGGWAYQSDIPNTALTVHIYIINNSTGEQKIIGVTAGGYRADLKNAGYGNGYHAFHYAVNWKTYKPGTYTVRAYAIGVNSSNPQLSYSPKTFTVRSATGNVEYVNSSGIGGWAWKPDAPDLTIDVHIYIYKSDGTQVAVYSPNAWQPRSDLLVAGYGDGDHGFTQAINWSALPEERLRIVVYAVDGSGYNPSLYSGYYDNRMPIHLIGMIDDYGIDFSSWATTEIINYAYDIGTPSVIKCTGATKENLLNYIQDSSFATVYTHGTQRSISWSKTIGTTEATGTLTWSDFLTMDDDRFSKTRCLLLVSCSGASEAEYPAGNNMVNVFNAKGVQTVVGFKNEVWFWSYDDLTINNNLGTGRWAKVFVEELSEGATVKTAVIAAIADAITSFEDVEELDADKRRADAYELAEGYGLVNIGIAGDENQVVKH